MVQLNDSDWANLTISPTGLNWYFRGWLGHFIDFRKDHLFVALFEGYGTSWILKKVLRQSSLFFTEVQFVAQILFHMSFFDFGFIFEAGPKMLDNAHKAGSFFWHPPLRYLLTSTFHHGWDSRMGLVFLKILLEQLDPCPPPPCSLIFRDNPSIV